MQGIGTTVSPLLWYTRADPDQTPSSLLPHLVPPVLSQSSARPDLTARRLK